MCYYILNCKGIEILIVLNCILFVYISNNHKNQSLFQNTDLYSQIQVDILEYQQF